MVWSRGVFLFLGRGLFLFPVLQMPVRSLQYLRKSAMTTGAIKVKPLRPLLLRPRDVLLKLHVPVHPFPILVSVTEVRNGYCPLHTELLQGVAVRVVQISGSFPLPLLPLPLLPLRQLLDERLVSGRQLVRSRIRGRIGRRSSTVVSCIGRGGGGGCGCGGGWWLWRKRCLVFFWMWNLISGEERRLQDLLRGRPAVGIELKHFCDQVRCPRRIPHPLRLRAGKELLEVSPHSLFQLLVVQIMPPLSGGHQIRCVVAYPVLEGQAPAEDLTENAPQRKHLGLRTIDRPHSTVVDRYPQDLRCIVPPPRAGSSLRLRPCSRIPHSRPEVAVFEEGGIQAQEHKNIRHLNVPVREALRQKPPKSLDKLPHDFLGQRQRQRVHAVLGLVFCQPVVQVPVRSQFHDDAESLLSRRLLEGESLDHLDHMCFALTDPKGTLFSLRGEDHVRVNLFDFLHGEPLLRGPVLHQQDNPVAPAIQVLHHDVHFPIGCGVHDRLVPKGERVFRGRKSVLTIGGTPYIRSRILAQAS
mmetsp:Transcript_437/g.973  ORF Transcript_437/g.973 Transcript_437/m.973 type:complete len:525 (-) Transcript_437:113-1687(-)